ncbi:hypothetical protein ABMA70_02255 [Halobacteriovorax sp. XZX-3]|uniref:hypothetical protein n=1 Tax=unclassified Halobacteriovorax TaxID=2639665 RepID=UPI000CD236EB|nr:hypothetical protein [Halobacteriovorax sp. DA5]POB14566.1 hypothetical protein C0Z22_05590 [Halobacteriovorax sp. DA5]
MALNIKKLENPVRPTDQISSDQTRVKRLHKGCDGSKNFDESNNDSKRMSLIKSFVEELYERKRSVKKKLKDKKEKMNEAIRRLNIL